MSHVEREFNYDHTRRPKACEYIVFFLFFFLISSLQIQDAFCQYWTELVPPVPQDYTDFITPYFLNSNYGFYIDNQEDASRNYHTRLKRTADRGSSFKEVFIGNDSLVINQLCFVSPNHGYAATSGGIYETIDSGTNWALKSSTRPFNHVYAVGNYIFATINAWESYFSNDGDPSGRFRYPLFYSTDEGLAWDSITTIPGVSENTDWSFETIYGNRDSLVAAVFWKLDSTNAYYFPSSYLAYSLDLGRTWNSTPLDHDGSRSDIALHISPHSCQITRQVFDKLDPDADEYDFLSAYPPYQTWDTSIGDREVSAYIAGNDCAMYIPVAAESIFQPGGSDDFYRSTDQGVTWQGIPERYNDYWGNIPAFMEIDDEDWPVLSVVGYGATIYAGHWTGSLWRVDSGGDGSLNEAALAPQIVFGHVNFVANSDTLIMAQCDGDTATAYYQNTSCALTELDSISLEGLDSSEYTRSVIHRLSCDRVGDSIYFVLHPSFVGTRDITIHAHFTDDEYATIDTTVHFILVVNQGAMPDTIRLPGIREIGDTVINPGDSVGVTFVPGAGTLAATDSVTLTLRWDADAVSLSSLQVPSGWWVSDSSRVGRASSPTSGTAEILTITLRSDSAQSLPDPLLHAEFHTYLSPDETRTGTSAPRAFIYLDSAQSFFPQTTPCAPTVLSLQQSDSVELDFTGCGDSLLEAEMNHEPPFTIESIVPNPASTAIAVTVSGNRGPGSGMEVQMFDDLGNCVLDQRPGAALATGAETAPLQLGAGAALQQSSNYTLSPTPYTLTLDVSSLPSGIYFLRISSGGFAVSRSVAIER